MRGGTIGRVDMKLDNNVFDMQGGTILGNLVTGFGDDTILVSGTSYIGGNISTSGGDDIDCSQRRHGQRAKSRQFRQGPV